jgi:nucleoside-diphosphate-sugar epimerase
VIKVDSDIQNFPHHSLRQSLLITGAKGRLAQAALPELEKIFSVRTTDIVPPSPGDQDYHQADITQFGQVKPLLSGIDAVVHLAIASIRTFGAHINSPDDLNSDQAHAFDESTIRVNVDGTRHIYEAARLAGVKKIVYLSSMTAFQGDKDIPSYEKNTPFNPQSLYACTKIFGENLAQVYARVHGISIIVLRLGQPYPSGTRLDNIWQTNRRARSLFVTLEDTVQAILCALKTDIDFGAYNIVSASDHQRVNLRPAQEEIGYHPRAHFSEEGLTFLPAPQP